MNEFVMLWLLGMLNEILWAEKTNKSETFADVVMIAMVAFMWPLVAVLRMIVVTYYLGVRVWREWNS